MASRVHDRLERLLDAGLLHPVPRRTGIPPASALQHQLAAVMNLKDVRARLAELRTVQGDLPTIEADGVIDPDEHRY